MAYLWLWNVVFIMFCWHQTTFQTNSVEHSNSKCNDSWKYPYDIYSERQLTNQYKIVSQNISQNKVAHFESEIILNVFITDAIQEICDKNDYIKSSSSNDFVT